jgi:hypothetical protein
MITLAIDPSLRLPGFALYDDEAKCLKVFSLKLKAKLTRVECLIEIESKIKSILN